MDGRTGGPSGAPAGRTGRIIPVPMDGNCLFHSALRELARVGLAGGIHTAKALRTALLDWVETHGTLTCADLQLATWIELETDEDLATYCARLRRDGQWGGTVELFALAELFRVTACVWEPIEGQRGSRYHPRHTFAASAGDVGCSKGGGDVPASVSAAPEPCVHLHYNGSSHYSIFVPDREEDGTGGIDGSIDHLHAEIAVSASSGQSAHHLHETH